MLASHSGSGSLMDSGRSSSSSGRGRTEEKALQRLLALRLELWGLSLIHI